MQFNQQSMKCIIKMTKVHNNL